MDDYTHIARRPVLEGIGAAVFVGFGKSTPLAAEGLDRAPNVLVFDVAETLLDLQALRPFFQRLFGKVGMVDEWFGETVFYSETATLTNTFIPFAQLGGGVLRMLGRIHNVAIGEADVAELGKGLAVLPPHPDVPESLKKLKVAGYRLVTLTDAKADPGQGPLRLAGLADLFERQFTAETVRRYKPARETYGMVADAVGTPLSGLCMIASHPWDLVGARTAGCAAALIDRAGVAPFSVPGLKQPQIVAPTLTEIAAELIRVKQT
jgi:2-haloacid dehalogenase